MSMSFAYDAVLPHVNNVSYFSVIDWLHLNTCVDTQRSSSSFMSATVSSVQFVYLFFILHQYIQFKGKMPPNNAFKGLLHCFPQIFNSIFLFLSWNLLWQYDNVELRYKAMFPSPPLCNRLCSRNHEYESDEDETVYMLQHWQCWQCWHSVA